VFAHQSLLLPPLTDRPRAELKKGLYALFSQFGSILEINVSSAFRLRGQAWIVFKDVPSATKAMRDLQGFMFFDKQMVRTHAHTYAPGGCGLTRLLVFSSQRIQFAKDTSDPIAKIEGRDVDKDARRARKRQRDQEFRTCRSLLTCPRPRRTAASSSSRARRSEMMSQTMEEPSEYSMRTYCC